MYVRYFLWNFVGRQNDIQGSGEPEHGNWITGISWLDNLRLGDQKAFYRNLCSRIKAQCFLWLAVFIRTTWYLLAMGTWEERQATIQCLVFLFFMTGLAIVLYLNQTPGQPRERDYAYAGSFYAFAIWIGMGPAGCCDMLRRKHFKVLPVSLTHATLPTHPRTNGKPDLGRSRPEQPVYLP